MDDKEKLAFLKKMGFSVGRLNNTEEEKKRQRQNNRFDKSDIIALAKIFNVTSEPKKPQTFEEFAKKEEGCYEND